MDPKDIKPELTRLGYDVGSQTGMSHNGFILISVNGHLLRFEEAYALMRGEKFEEVIKASALRRG